MQAYLKTCRLILSAGRIAPSVCNGHFMHTAGTVYPRTMVSLQVYLKPILKCRSTHASSYLLDSNLTILRRTATVDCTREPGSKFQLVLTLGALPDHILCPPTRGRGWGVTGIQRSFPTLRMLRAGKLVR